MDEPPSNVDLVRRAQDGDVPAVGTPYYRALRPVWGGGGDAGPGGAEDVTHDAFLRAYRNLGTLRDPARFSGWLVGIARLIVRERRRARRFEPLTDDLTKPAEHGTEDAAELLHLVARLPEEERLAIRFYFLNERSIAETAAILERSRSGTYAILQRAKCRLALWLRECGVSR